jgi:cell division protein FtsB
MNKTQTRQRPRNHVRNISLTLFLVGLIFYFAYHAINGERGILAFFNLSGQISKAQAKLDSLKSERLEKEYKVKALRPDSLDLDLLDEQARTLLGYAAGNEQVYIVE